MNMKKETGSFYLETVIAMSMLTIVGTTLLPMYPRILKQSVDSKIQANLLFLGTYVGNYIFRWTGFSPEKKPIVFENYTEGVELESFLTDSTDKRVNQLFWADPLIAENPEIENRYKVSILFKDTQNRVDSAVLRVQIWFDTNDDDVLSEGEKSLVFNTIVTEKGLPIQ